LKKHVVQLIHDKGEGNLQLYFQRALTMVCRRHPKGHVLQIPTNKTWKQCEPYTPHVLSLLNVYLTWKPDIGPTLEFATLLYDLGNYMWERGIKTAGEILQAGEDVCTLLTDLPETIPIYANLCAIGGAVQGEIGFSGRAMAREKCERALQLRKQRVKQMEASGSLQVNDVMLLAMAWNDVGVVKIQSCEYDAALTDLEESLRLRRRYAVEDDHPWHFGETFKNLAFVRSYQGRLDEAEDLAHRACELCSRGMGEKSAATLKAQFIEATILWNSNKIKEALNMHKSIYRARDEVFGSKHMLTKDSLYSLGEISRLRGKMEKAEYVIECIIARISLC
jgi:tetratricopeptide (TPR) repeat protein